VVDFPAGLYINNTLTVSTGVNPDATATVTVNTRNVIPVGGGTDGHTTIQSALNGLFAWFGTSAFSTSTAGYLSGAKTIEVYNGTYTETVTPNVSLGTTASEHLIIQNASGQQPAVDASGLNNAFYVGALDYVEISGVKGDVILSEAKTAVAAAQANPVIKIYTVLGECVLTHSLTPSEGGYIRIDVSALVPGVYFVRVGGQMYKFVKM
jgi:hypothetical protein